MPKHKRETTQGNPITQRKNRKIQVIGAICLFLSLVGQSFIKPWIDEQVVGSIIDWTTHYHGVTNANIVESRIHATTDFYEYFRILAPENYALHKTSIDSLVNKKRDEDIYNLRTYLWAAAEPFEKEHGFKNDSQRFRGKTAKQVYESYEKEWYPKVVQKLKLAESLKTWRKILDVILPILSIVGTVLLIFA